MIKNAAEFMKNTLVSPTNGGLQERCEKKLCSNKKSGRLNDIASERHH